MEIIKKEIQVTQHDINLGIRADCHLCPVALAIERALGVRDVGVYHGTADWTQRKTRWGTNLPLEVQVFIADFDAGAPVKPFSFEI